MTRTAIHLLLTGLERQPGTADTNRGPEDASARPRCVTPEQYALWLEAASASASRLPRLGLCADCNPGYQARMKLAGLCDHPDVLFDDDGGYLPLSTENTKK